MSSTSIARQNRRKRLKQNITNSNAASDINSADEISANSGKESDLQSNYNSSDVKSKHEYDNLSFTSSCNFLNNDASSRPVEKIFIEGDRGFKEINASEIFHITNSAVSVEASENEMINAVLNIAKYFHKLSNFCHGLLGGLSLLYILFLLHLFSDLLIDEDTIKYFSFFCKPIHNVFNFLCTICCISVLDRFDVTSAGELFKLIKKFDFKLITLLIYPICLILSLSTANVDDKLTMPDQNATVWESLNFKEESELYYWKTLSISKGFGGLLGWMVISWDQNFNLLLDNMRSILNKRRISLH